MEEIRMVESTCHGELYHVCDDNHEDLTLYDFYVLKRGDNFVFLPCKSTFPFPKEINFWEIKSLSGNELEDKAGKEKINFYTFKECIKIVKVLSH